MLSALVDVLANMRKNKEDKIYGKEDDDDDDAVASAEDEWVEDDDDDDEDDDDDDDVSRSSFPSMVVPPSLA